MAWLDALLGRIFSRGVEIPYGAGLDFKAPLSAALNTGTTLTEVNLADGELAPAKLAPAADGLSVPLAVRAAFTALVTGTADDVTVLEVPYGLRILDVWARIETEVEESTVRLYTAVSAGGTALSSGLASDVAGVSRDNGDTERTVTAGQTIYLNRSDRAVAGVVYILCERT